MLTFTGEKTELHWMELIEWAYVTLVKVEIESAIYKTKSDTRSTDCHLQLR